jgi:MFS family permease
VNVVLPSIRDELGVDATSLAWIVNAYKPTFGGFLLLGGRLGDHLGHRRVFVAGIALFTLASLSAGTSETQGFLVAARACRNSAVAAGGATIGVAARRRLTDILNITKRHEGSGRLRAT